MVFDQSVSNLRNSCDFFLQRLAYNCIAICTDLSSSGKLESSGFPKLPNHLILQAHGEMEIIASHYASGWHRPKSPHHNTSIDEHLGKYRPTQNSILEFIACLDDSSFFSTHQGRDHLIVRESVLISGEKIGASSSTSEAVPLSQLEPDKQKRKSTDEPSDLDELNACGCINSTRSRRKSTSIKEKEDRRRDQNREAQRRYREKNMLSSPPNLPEMPLNQWGRGPISFIGQW